MFLLLLHQDVQMSRFLSCLFDAQIGSSASLYKSLSCSPGSDDPGMVLWIISLLVNKSLSSQNLTIIMGCLFLHNTGKYYFDKLHFILFYGTKIFYLKKWYKWKNLSGCFSATYRKDKVIGFRYIFKIYFLNNFTSSVFISFLLLSLSLSNLPVSTSPSQFLTSTSTVNTVTYVHIHITK